MAFSAPVHFLTNNYSEVQADLFGILWCSDHNCQDLSLELDSLLVVNMILGTYNSPWRLKEDITLIQQRVQPCNNMVSRSNIATEKGMKWPTPYPNTLLLSVSRLFSSTKMTYLLRPKEPSLWIDCRSQISELGQENTQDGLLSLLKC